MVLTMACVANAMTLDCNFKNLKDLDDHTKEVYACESFNVTNREQNEPINYVTNLHDMGRRDRDVKILIIKKQICYFLPRRIENFFPHLQEIEVDSSGLRQLLRENFASLTKLTMAIFPGNEIEFLPGDLFIYNPRLTHINFSQNRISNVGHNFFSGLRNLRYLLFDDNECYQGYGMVLEEVEVVKNEILQNCSSILKQEKRIVIKVEEVKAEEEKPVKEEDKQKSAPQVKINEPRHDTNRCSCQQRSIEIILICFHLHVFASLFSEKKIKL